MAVPWLEYVVLGGLALWCLVGVLLTVVRMPGTWAIIAGAALHGWWTQWSSIGWLTLGLLIAAAVVAEIIEFLASSVVAKGAGASRRAAVGGFLGAFFGMFMLSFLVPIPLVGTVIGAIAGCFLGALIGELSAQSKLEKVARVGAFSAVGLVIGMVTKMAISAAMAGVVLFAAFTTTPKPAATTPADPPATVQPAP
ncbi:MAG: DUF456 domain-containing protein [Phycisphaerae bacterium]